MAARAAAGFLLIALAIPGMSQTTLTIDEVRQRMEQVKADYKGDEAFAKSLDTVVQSLQQQYGDRIPAIAVIKAVRQIPLPEPKAAPAPAVDAKKPPDGITVEQTLDGFHLRAFNRQYGFGLIWLVFIGALCLIPFRAFPDLIRDILSGEGLTLWLGGAFLAAYTAGVLYAAGMGAVTAFGEVRITRAGDDGAVFTGIGDVGRTRHIHWSDFSGAGEQAVAVDTGRRFTRTEYYVALTGSQKRVRFGADFTDEQRAFIIRFLRDQVFGATTSTHP